jgi:hypothetical protein
MGLENEIEEHQLITAQQRDMRKLTLCFVDESLFLSCWGREFPWRNDGNWMINIKEVKQVLFQNNTREVTTISNETCNQQNSYDTQEN